MEEDEPQPVDQHNAHPAPRTRRILARVEVSDWIASIAALTAVVSLVISVLGYRLAQQQTALSRDQFEQSSSFWWLCSVDENLTLSLIPSRNDIVVESVDVVFPKALFQHAENWAFKPKNLRLPLQDIRKRLTELRASEITFDKATGRFNVHAVRNQLPVIVESRYIINGSMHFDRTLFFIKIRSKWVLGPRGVDNVHLQNLLLSDAYLYGKLADDSDHTDEVLRRYWDVAGDKVIAQVAPIGGPVTLEGPFPPRGASDSLEDERSERPANSR